MSSDQIHSLQPLFPGGRPDRRHWGLAVAAGMASYLDSSIIVSVGVGLVLLQGAFDISTLGAGILSSVLTLAIAAGALLGGRLSDRFGRIRVFTIDILVYALGMAIAALSVNQAMLFVGLIIAGIAAGADLPTSVAVVSERSPAGAQGRLVSFTQLMWFIGIAVTQLLAFALSGIGVLGIRIIFGELVLAALATWAIRRFHPALRSLEEEVVERRGTTDAQTARIGLGTLIRSKHILIPLALTGVFYIFWGLVANTFGQFQTYFLITAGGADQTLATGLNVALLPVGLIVSALFVRIVDTRWRNVVFVVGGVIQAVSMSVAGLGNGVLLIYVLALVLFGIGANLSGEAAYKVWTQESLPVAARASVQGLTYGVGRFVFALFALVTPSLLAGSRDLLLWMLVVFSLLGLAAGIGAMRYLTTLGIRPGRVPEETPSATPDPTR